MHCFFKKDFHKFKKGFCLFFIHNIKIIIIGGISYTICLGNFLIISFRKNRISLMYKMKIWAN